MIERRRAPSAALPVNPPKLSPPRERRRHPQIRYFALAIVACFLSTALIFRHDLSTVESEVGVTGTCDKYKGILMITQGDSQGAAGTIFFLFILNQLLYAERHSLIPWIHLNDVSQYVYDPKVHGTGKPFSFEVPSVVNASWTSFVDQITKQEVAYAGSPLFIQPSPTRKTKITVTGNGVWSSYFHPVSRFSPNDPSCSRLPLVRLTHQQIIPALHVHCPWSLRAWRYGGLPPSLRSDHLSYNKWFLPMREKGANLVEKKVQFLPYLHRMAQDANPFQRCLAVHIRDSHSDKANRRRKIAVKKFLPYVQAFAEEQLLMKGEEDFSIFIATDSQQVVEKIRNTWPAEIWARIRWQQGEVVRSNDTTPVFVLSSHHATNMQVLVDIIAMSKCQFLLHGLSAVSEATHYLNRNLHRNHSVNLELPKHAGVPKFREMIKKDNNNYRS